MYRLENFEPLITFICIGFVAVVAFFLLSGGATQDRSLFQALPDVNGTQAPVEATSERVIGFPITGGIPLGRRGGNNHGFVL